MNLLVRVKEKILSSLLPKIKSSGYYAVRNIFDDLVILINKESPFIIDGGANLGETTEEFLSKFQNPTIYSFEANPNLARELADHFIANKNVHVVAKAIGNQNTTVEFSISKNLNSSSFLEHSNILKEYHGDITDTKEKISVEMVTLDSVFSAEKVIDLLKLDIEGYELEALKGAEKILPITRAIMTEVWFAKGYNDAPSFSDIDIYLRQHGFSILNIYNPYTHKDMQMTTADAVFVNNKFFNDRKHFG